MTPDDASEWDIAERTLDSDERALMRPARWAVVVRRNSNPSEVMFSTTQVGTYARVRAEVLAIASKHYGLEPGDCLITQHRTADLADPPNSTRVSNSNTADLYDRIFGSAYDD